MASSSFSTHPNFFLSLMLAFLLIPSSQGQHDYFVGDSQSSWTLPRPYPEFLSHWAHRRHFKVGDTLVWKYDSKSESVLEVKEEDYKSCNIKSPISKHNDGDTKVELNRTGSFYFISGTDGHCHQGLRLDLVVHAGHHHRGNGHRSPTPVSKTVTSLSPASAHSPRGVAAPPKTNGAAALGCCGGGLFVGLVTGLGVALLVTVI